MISNDKKILSEIINGNKSAYNDMFQIYYRSLCYYAQKYFEDNDEIEDIVQDVMIKIWEKRKELKIDNLKNYLFTSVKNSCINRLHHLKIVNNHKESSATELMILELKSDSEIYNMYEPGLEQKIENAINQLPPQCTNIIRMKYVDGLKAKEIAEITNTSQRTVETHIYKGVKLLSEQFKHLLLSIILLFNYFFN